MIDLLISIPGPQYLLYYSVFAVAVIIISKLLADDDGSENLPTPEAAVYTPYDIAYMKEGTLHVIKTAIFSLWRQKLIEVTGMKASDARFNLVKNAPPRENEIENIVYNYLKLPATAAEIERDDKLRSEIEKAMSSGIERMKKDRLVKNEADSGLAWQWTVFCGLLTVLGGAVKIVLGIYRGKNVGFLVILTLIFFFIGFFTIYPFRVTTVLGRRFLASSKDKLKWAIDKLKAGNLPEGFDPALLVAIFGISEMGGSPYELFISYFVIPDSGGSNGCSNSSGCGGGGGSGCGGCGG